MIRLCIHCNRLLGEKPPYKGRDFDGTPFRFVKTGGICDECMEELCPEVMEERRAQLRRKKRRDEIVQRDAILERNKEIVKTGICPDCGSPLKYNSAIKGWWQCVCYGEPNFRKPEFKDKPKCYFQCFTE